MRVQAKPTSHSQKYRRLHIHYDALIRLWLRWGCRLAPSSQRFHSDTSDIPHNRQGTTACPKHVLHLPHPTFPFTPANPGRVGNPPSPLHLPHVNQPPRSPHSPHQPSSVLPETPSLKLDRATRSSFDSTCQSWLLNLIIPGRENPTSPAHRHCPVCHHQIHKRSTKVSASTITSPEL